MLNQWNFSGFHWSRFGIECGFVVDFLFVDFYRFVLRLLRLCSSKFGKRIGPMDSGKVTSTSLQAFEVDHAEKKNALCSAPLVGIHSVGIDRLLVFDLSNSPHVASSLSWCSPLTTPPSRSSVRSNYTSILIFSTIAVSVRLSLESLQSLPSFIGTKQYVS